MDEDVPFRWQDDGELQPGAGPTVRENVDAGVDVINLTEMRQQLEADRAARQGGGG